MTVSMDRTKHKRNSWHTLSLLDLCKQLKVDGSVGISRKEAVKRQERYGVNELVVAARPSVFRLFFGQFNNALIWILFAGIVFSVLSGKIVEAVTIGAITFLAAVLGFVQEWHAERALEALRDMSAPLALVLRDGVEQEIPARDVVPGDVLILVMGDRVPADARILSEMNVKVDEAALTGESVSVGKNSTAVYPEGAALGDQRNMVFAGTNVTYGRARAVVVATGMQTEFGKIARLLEKVKPQKTPLQLSLNQLGVSLSKWAIFLVFFVVVIGVFRGQGLVETLVFGIALAVAAVPEALPAVVTIALAIGVQRMSKRNALIRYLPAVETLGCTTYICSDKTGTLTKDEMTVRRVLLGADTILEVTGSGYDPKGSYLMKGMPFEITDHLRQLLRAAVLSSDASVVKTDGTWGLNGDPTEAALVVAAGKAGVQKELVDETFPRIAEIPFSSEAKRMTTLNQTPNGTVAYVKGAAEVLLASCSHIQMADGIAPLTEPMRAAIRGTIQSFAQSALRVIASAYLPVSDIAQADRDLIFLGVFGMIDPPRPEVKAAIQTCRDAGIKILMITGDHADTAGAIARELNILQPDGRIVTGSELDTMNQAELEHEVESISVCARVSPSHKLRVVEALQARGHVVAMTGDGINDAPALKKANIGIAMGITGTDVTKEAAVMTLVDDNFASIVAAIEEGRIVFTNIKKFLIYLLSSNIGEIGLVVTTALLGLPLPLTAVQILYINLASDGLPALALAVDSGDGEVMRLPPRDHKAGIFNRSIYTLMAIGGGWIVVSQLALFVWAKSIVPLDTAMTISFVSIVLMQLLNTYCFRPHYHSILSHPFSNRWLNRAVAWELLLLVCIITIPFFQTVFHVNALSLFEWSVAAITAFTTIPVLELTKYLLRKHSV